MTTSINSMLDGSLFTDNSYESTFEMRNETAEEMDYYISETFYDIVVGGRLNEEPSVRNFFNAYDDFDEYDEMATRLENTEITPFSAQRYVEDYQEEYNTLVARVSEERGEYQSYNEGDLLPDVLFDEFLFSIEYSPILSRLKKTANALKSTVACTIEMSEERLDRSWNYFQESANQSRQSFEEFIKSLEENADERLEGDSPIVVSTYLRQIVKDYSPNWIIHISNSYVPVVAGWGIGQVIGPMGGLIGGLSAAGIQDLVMYLADP